MKPLIINRSEPMAKVRIVTMRDSSDKALKTLHKIGVMQVEEAKELKPADKAAIDSQGKEVGELLGFLDDILGYLQEKQKVSLLGDDVEVIYTRPFKDVSSEVKTLYRNINWIFEKTVKYDDEIKQLTVLKRQLESLDSKADLKLKDLGFTGEYIFSRVFIFPKESFETLNSRLKEYILESITGNLENQVVVCAIGRVKNLKAIESILQGTGVTTLQIPEEDITLKGYIQNTAKKIQSLEEELAKARQELQDKVKGDLKKIVLMREALSAESEKLAVLGKAAETKYVTLIEGWIPQKNVEDVGTELRTNLEYVFVDSREPVAGEIPPSKLDNAKLLKPFELIVKMMDIPKYAGWDPTPVTAYSFAFFYGLMMGDVIYGLGLMAAARFLLPKFVDDPNTAGFKLFQRILYTCATVAIVIGLSSGSYMGDIHQTVFGLGDIGLVPFVSKLLGNPMSFVIFGILVGLVHVDLAHLLAMIKGVQDKNKGVVLNRVGLFMIQFAIPGALITLLKVTIPLSSQTLAIFNYLTLAGVGLIIISNLMMNKAIGAFLWMFDITGIFGDVVSYARLAGVGMAGFYLGHALNLMVIIFGKVFPGTVGFIVGTAMGLVIFVFGHLINVTTSSIGCFVHSMRLCFVEFLTKFFDGGGRDYSPFILRKRATVEIQTK